MMYRKVGKIVLPTSVIYLDKLIVVVLREALSKENTPFVKLMRLGQGDLPGDIKSPFPQVKGVNLRNYRMHRQLSPVDRAQLAEQYQLGMSALELARKYKIHKTTAVKHVKREGVAVRGGQVRMTPDALERAKRLYANGNSLATIGGQLGVDASTVHKALKKEGVKMRDTHGREV